ncbi:MAG: YhjD/YihY/BrkB family envelope integrity protein [Natrialbaceae archaeon]|nr:YhjD/YihY/BrkB family envelope integrity protein [Natrialbaceae archaeon]
MFELYLVYSSPAAKSSLLAAVIVLMTWLYFNALIVLVGAAVNAVLSNRSEDVRIDPVIGGLAPAARESDPAACCGLRVTR